MSDDDRSAVPDQGAGTGSEPTRQFPAVGGPAAAYSQWQTPEAGHGAPAPDPQQPHLPGSGHQPAGPQQPSAAPQFPGNQQFPGPQQPTGAAAVMSSGTVRRVRSMPWQERALRLPGALAVFAGLLTLLSCLFSWWAVFDRSMGDLIEYTVTPFRGVSASSGSRWSDMAAMNALSASELEVAENFTIAVGFLLVVSALCMVVGGLLILLARAQLVGVSLTLLGAVFLGYARIPSEMVGSMATLATDARSALTDPAGPFSDLFGSIIPEARFGLGLATFALTIVTLALLIYLGMIIYRETIRIRRWMA